MEEDYRIYSAEELREIYGQPAALVQNKFTTELVEEMAEFVEASPLLFLSTLDGNGGVDISPRGDAPGFVRIDEQGSLLIPDRPGNKLVYSHTNILSNENVGLIFVVPNLTETLRVQGRAKLSRDPRQLEELGVKGKAAKLCTIVEPTKCWFHCGKAMIRSKAWNPESWETHDNSPMVRQFMKVLGTPSEESRKAIEAAKEQNYRDELY